MQGTMRLAGTHAPWNGVSAAHVLESRASMDFLDRILIFGYQFGISLPGLGHSNSRAAISRLLYGHINVDFLNTPHHFITHIRLLPFVLRVTGTF